MFNILIADDSSTMRSVVARTLELGKVPVGRLFFAADGREALGILNTEWIDLVLADINMPVLDGLALVESMSSDSVLRSVPVVVMSSDTSPTKMLKLRSAGVRSFVRKPFTPEIVRDTVMEVLGGPTIHA